MLASTIREYVVSLESFNTDWVGASDAFCHKQISARRPLQEAHVELLLTVPPFLFDDAPRLQTILKRTSMTAVCDMK